jgi:ribulose 1,5-bisphosphate carboxylase large subunit-like protein
MRRIKVSDYAEEHEELKTALTKWGGARTSFQM